MVFLNFSFIQGGILGFIIAAVSPAVLIPSMVDLIERKIGEKKAIILSMVFLNFSFIQGGILGFIIAAVSPAVLIPSMVDLIERKIGEKKAILKMLLVGASADDTVAITFFTTFMSLYFSKIGGEKTSILSELLIIPISIILSIIVGVLISFTTKCIFKFLKSNIFKVLLYVLGVV